MQIKNFSSKLLLVAFFLTLIVIGAKGYLPEKKFTISDTSGTYNFFLLEPELKKVAWIDRDKLHFSCTFNEMDNHHACGYMLLLSEDGVHGKDLSKFDAINLDIKYTGDAKKLRIAIRHFDPRFSTEANSNSSKFNFVSVRTKDLDKPIRIELNEFTVADWWSSGLDLPRNQTHPDVSNAITFAIDIEGDLKNSAHDIQLNKIEFIGDWTSTENWYLGILLIWISVGAFFTIGRLVYLEYLEGKNEAKISNLVIKNDQLKIETDKLRELSTVDSLTNAYNRHGIEEFITSLAIGFSPTAIILIDIDHFKHVNDSRGHDAGDRVLKKMSEVIILNTRGNDKFGRWGGEEFILICPDTATSRAAGLAEKLRGLIAETVFEPDKPIPLTASFGVASVLPNELFASAFKRADQALYIAKNQGRNCVVVADQPTPE